MKLCFSRPLITPIDIRAEVPDVYHYHSRICLGIAFPDMNHVRSLYLDLYVRDWEGDVVATLPLLLDYGLFLLKELRSQSVCPIYHMPTDIAITSQRFPHLHSLELVRTAAPQGPSLYTQLRTLSLDGSPHNLSFDHFLDALVSCTGLEDLCLASTPHRLSGDWTKGGLSPRLPLVSHPRLCRFAILGHEVACTYRFLAHFRVHPSASLEISANIEGEEVDTRSANRGLCGCHAFPKPRRRSRTSIDSYRDQNVHAVLQDGRDLHPCDPYEFPAPRSPLEQGRGSVQFDYDALPWYTPLGRSLPHPSARLLGAH